MKTISKEFAKKISGIDLGVYDTKKYRYFEMCGRYCRIARKYLGTTEILNYENWERLEVRA